MKRVNLLQLLFLLFTMPVSAQIFGGKNLSEKLDQLIADNYNGDHVLYIEIGLKGCNFD